MQDKPRLGKIVLAEQTKRKVAQDYSSTNILEAKEGSKRGNSRNASHQNPRNGRNRKICNYVVSQKIISRN